MAGDTYKTIRKAAQGYYTEKRSRFISYALPVQTADEIKALLECYRKRYHDARHVCWAYTLGSERAVCHVNDDGEPSSTAGKPILGQIKVNSLTNILVIVVRYFGGIELGAGGLIAAYRTAAADAITHTEIVERTIDEDVTVCFKYPRLNDIMRIVKEERAAFVEQSFLEADCRFILRIRRGSAARFKERLLKVAGVQLNS